MLNIFFISIIFSYLISSPFNEWINDNEEIINQKNKSVSFQIVIDSNMDVGKNKILNGNIVVGEKKQFRFNIGPRTVVSDGKIWKSYDSRTDQIFIQKPDKKMEQALFSWTNIKKLRRIPIEMKSDGSYRLKFFGIKNDVRAFFSSNSNLLDSILISSKNGFHSKIFDIRMSITDTLVLNVGSENSDLFDLR